MNELSGSLRRGEPARLFPVLSETSKEGRATCVFLSCLANVREYGAALMSSMGQRAGTRARIETYTEISFDGRKDEKILRPDGLIVLTVGSRRWSALVEAKVGGNDLDGQQVENYIALAQRHSIDAVITISNAFSPSPNSHPLQVKTRANGKVQLFHWSWMYLLTEADLLLSNDGVGDTDQKYILSELTRFLTHKSTGVKGFDAMPKAWGDLASTVRNGGVIVATSADAQKVVGAWHQEVRDLSLILSRQTGVEVTVQLSRALRSDNAMRFKADLNVLCDTHTLSAVLIVPGAAAPLEICCDLRSRTIAISVRLQAPADKKSTKARMNWMLRQLSDTPVDDVFARLHWPGRAPFTQHSLSDLRADVQISEEGKAGMQVGSIEICMVRQLGARFSQSRNFITDLEKIVPDFYRQTVEHLKAWQPPAPRIRENRAEASDVTPSAIGEDADAYARDDSRDE